MRSLRILGACILVAACSSGSTLRPFTSDGCSLFPDRSLINRDDWCSCCFEHDIAYWRGGTQQQRAAADLALRDCIAQKTGNENLATMMHDGVRFGGSPYFYNWYRWGYGWGYDRRYQSLSESETQLADQLLQAYFDSEPPAVCPTE